MATESNPAVRVLEKERESVAADIERLQANLKEAKHTLRHLDDAISVLTGVPAPDRRGEGPTLKELVADQLRTDGPGMTPLEIANALTNGGRETGNTTVSSMLSRLKNENVAEKRGDRWFKTKGPDVVASEPFGQLGPATGRGTVFPATPPEGSIPSGSTASRLADLYREPSSQGKGFDDEIPF